MIPSTPQTIRCLLLSSLALVFLMTNISAQGLTGQISGTLTDSRGGAVTGATVEVINEETAQSRSVTANSEGHFVVTQLLPGTYTLKVMANGFKKFEQKGIILTANERVSTRNVTLEVGDVNEVVTVAASTAHVQTESGERAGLISEAQIKDLALKGRDYMGLVRLLPGVVDTANREAPGWNNLVGVNINGTRGGMINLTLDGVSSLDTGSQLGPYLAPGLDAIGEVKVLLTNYQAEYGRSSGGTINVVIKNGTREFHGGGFYFKRHEQFNANEYFNNAQGIPKQRYRFNYWGGNIGGPVIIPGTGFNKNRDKLFFFWSQEYLPRNYPTRQGRLTFPTERERSGDFSKSFIGVDPRGNPIPVTTRDPRTGLPFRDPSRATPDNPLGLNIIPVDRIDPNGQKLLSQFPLPNFNDPAFSYNTVFQSTVDQPRREEILRMDWNISSKTTFYARGIQNYEAFKGDFNFVLASNIWPQFPINYQIESRGLVSTLIHTFNSTLVNEFTFGINRALQTVSPLNQEGVDRNDRAKLGVALPQFYPANNPLNLLPNATFVGIPNPPEFNIEQRFPFFGTNNIWNWSDNISKIWGSHNVKAGFYLEYTTRNAARSAAFNGTFNFNLNVNNPNDTRHPFVNALTGNINAYTEANNKLNGHARYKNIEWFVQDNWRVSKRLTLDYGMRFYYIQPTIGAGDNLAYFDPELYDASQQPQLVIPYCQDRALTCSGLNRVGFDPVTNRTLPASSIGTFAPGSGIPFQGMQVVEESVLSSPGIEYGPRFGFAYDLSGDGKTSLRGGAGIFYDRFNDDQVLQLVEMPPNMITATANFTSIGALRDAPLSVSPPNVFAIQRDYGSPAVYNWSLGIQREIGFNTVLDVAYVGSVGRHLLHRRNLNAVPYGTRFKASSDDPTLTGTTPLPDNFLRPYRGYGNINYIEFAGSSNYHSLQVQANRRVTTSLAFGLSYTWSKAMDLVDGNNNNVNPFLDPNIRNYGKAGFDRTHNFAFNYIYKLPGLSRYWQNALTRTVLDGWELSGITSFISGQPIDISYSTVQGTDLMGGGGDGVDSRVVLTGNPNLPKGERTPTRHFDTSVVRAPNSPGDFGIGNAPKDPIRGPGINNWDISIFKNFRMGRDGRVGLQYRLEMYNAFNHTQFGGVPPVTGVDTAARFDLNRGGEQVNPRFGEYNAARLSRRIVMGLKINF
jgi:Carboxypeptidase regulatory-like domain